jgi:hypothetical protein
MRTARDCVLIVWLLSLVACGGGAAETDGLKAPGAPGAPGASSTLSPSDAGMPSQGDAAATTTTVALGSGGDLQGSKLSETHTVASTSGASAPAPKGPHTHDVGRGPDDIRAIVLARRDEARACYDGAIKDHPGIEGDLVIQWTIDPKGVVTQASVDPSRSQIVEPSVISCISEIIKKIQFAPSQGGFETKAYYPFNFHPHHGSTPRTP